MSLRSQREAWTAYVEGREPRVNKYSAIREGQYASKHEAACAAQLHALASRGLIRDLREQERIVLVAGNGKLRPVVYVADFIYTDLDGGRHVVDAKGMKTPVYRLKKRLAALLYGITIEEI